MSIEPVFVTVPGRRMSGVLLAPQLVCTVQHEPVSDPVSEYQVFSASMVEEDSSLSGGIVATPAWRSGRGEEVVLLELASSLEIDRRANLVVFESSDERIVVATVTGWPIGLDLREHVAAETPATGIHPLRLSLRIPVKQMFGGSASRFFSFADVPERFGPDGIQGLSGAGLIHDGGVVALQRAVRESDVSALQFIRLDFLLSEPGAVEVLDRHGVWPWNVVPVSMTDWSAGARERLEGLRTKLQQTRLGFGQMIGVVSPDSRPSLLQRDLVQLSDREVSDLGLASVDLESMEGPPRLVIEGPAGSGKSVAAIRMGLAAIEQQVLPVLARAGLVTSHEYPADDLDQFLELAAGSEQVATMTESVSVGRKVMLIVDGLNEASLAPTTVDRILRNAADRFDFVTVTSRPRLDRGYPSEYDTAVVLPLARDTVAGLTGSRAESSWSSLLRLPFFLDVYLTGGDLRTRYHAIESYVASCLVNPEAYEDVRVRNLVGEQLTRHLSSPMSALSTAAFKIYEKNGAPTFSVRQDQSLGSDDDDSPEVVRRLTEAFGSVDSAIRTGLLVEVDGIPGQPKRYQFRHQLIHDWAWRATASRNGPRTSTQGQRGTTCALQVCSALPSKLRS